MARMTSMEALDKKIEKAQELVKAIMNSDRTYEEVMEFLNAGSEAEEEA